MNTRTSSTKGKEEEYSKWTKEEGIPHRLSVTGFKEMRGYREMGSGKRVELEFESFEAWGKAMDDPKMKEIASKFASYTHGLKWKLGDIPPSTPEPLGPTK